MSNAIESSVVQTKHLTAIAMRQCAHEIPPYQTSCEAFESPKANWNVQEEELQ
jgi:hypothetical protein